MASDDEIVGYLEKQISVLDSLTENWVKYRRNHILKPKRSIWVRLEKILRSFLSNKNEENVVLMPGLRGVGKTTLLFQLNHQFGNRFRKGDVLYLSCDEIVKSWDTDLASILKMYEYKFLGVNLENLDEKVLVLIDEAHYQEDWASIVKSFSDRSENVLFIVTGSSALSLEITTDLARRTSEEKLFPLRFFEYILFESHIQKREMILPSKGRMGKIFDSCFSDLRPDLRMELLKNSLRDFRVHYFPKIGLLDKKMENFLTTGGFPFSISRDMAITYKNIEDIIRRVTEEDLPQFSKVGKKTVRKGLSCLRMAASAPEASDETIANSIGNISSESVSNLFKGYEKAGMVYTVKPYGTTEQVVSKSKKYYLASPTLQSCLWWSVGKFDTKTGNMGKLLETYVADILSRSRETKHEIIDYFYDYNKDAADFIVKLRGERKIAIEVGWGRKKGGQVLETLSRIKGDYGLIIGNGKENHKVKTKDGEQYDVFYIPKEAFIMI